MATIIKVAGKLTDTTLPIIRPELLLDGMANVDRAYSTRLIRGAYSGPLLRARRASDSATRDFGALPDGTLDTAALTAFASGGDAFVQTLYDQGPAGKHLIQATAAAQAKIVSAGVIVTANGKPALAFDGVDDAYVDLQPSLWAHGSATLAAVLTAGMQEGQRRWWAESRATANEQYGLLQADGRDGRVSMAYPVLSGTISDLTISPKPSLTVWDSTAKQLSSTDTGATFNQWVNGEPDLVAAAYSRPSRTVDRFTLGGVTRSGTLAGMAFTFSEAVWLKGAASTSVRNALESSQKAFFGIP